jgi:1,4-alpha-glucan branching enzyme
VVGDFNAWDSAAMMRVRQNSGVMGTIHPDLEPGKSTILRYATATGGILPRPIPGQSHELRPRWFHRRRRSGHVWATANGWSGAGNDWQHQPMSVYEVHLGSWQRGREGEFLDYRDSTHRLLVT